MGTATHRVAIAITTATPAGTYYFRVTVDGTQSNVATLTVSPVLTGTVTLSNTAPRVGDVITATYTGGNGTGTPTWSWLRNGTTTIAGATANTYTAVAADLGATLTARVTYSNQGGNVQSAPTAAVVVFQDGSAANPFLVGTAAQLAQVGSGTNGWTRDKHYRQTANITLSGTWLPIGRGSPNFTGSYDGGGFSVINLNIPSATSNFQGMFASIGTGGSVKNVALINANINSANDYTGGIAGMNNGSIENCYVSGTIIGRSDVGGIAGGNSNGVIKNCYTTCNVSGSNVNAPVMGGGIAGSNGGGIVQNCYTTGKINGHNMIGGIVGSNGVVENCVALNFEVTSNMDGGCRRVVGNFLIGTLTNNFARDSGMLLRAMGWIVTPTASATGRDGANATAANTHQGSSGTWWSGTVGFTTANWSFANNRLPHLLTTTGAAFAETQNPAVQ